MKPHTATEELKSILKVVQANDGLCGRSMITKILRGSRDKRLLDLGLDRSPGYGALEGKTLGQIGYVIDEALALGLIKMRDAGWRRGRKRQEAHFPVLFLAQRGADALSERALACGATEEACEPPSSERARAIVMRAMVQGAYALEDHKHHRIEAVDFVRESQGDHVVLFAMERHPRGEELMCLYLWRQRNNRVVEVESVPCGRISDVERWFERKLKEYRRRSTA